MAYGLDGRADCHVLSNLDDTLLGEYNDCKAVAGMKDELFVTMTATVINRVLPNRANSFPQEMEIEYVRVWQWETNGD